MNAGAITVERGGGLMSSERHQSQPYRYGVLFSLLVLALLIWGGWQLMNPSTLPIKHVSIEGEFRHLAPAVLQGSVTEVVRGGFFNVNVDTIQQTLLLEPWVKHVAVRRVWPDAITVYVQEQSAFARWGEQSLLNVEAEIFSPLKGTFPSGLPLLQGPENTQTLLLEYFHEAMTVLSPSGLSVVEINLNKRRAWKITLNNGLVIMLGRTNMKERLERFARYVPLQLAHRLEDIATVDMRYTNGFAVALKNGSRIVESGQEQHG